MPKRPQNPAGEKEGHEIPRWRKIEIMREKAALREALGDIDGDFDEFDEEVFGSDEEYMTFHEHNDVQEEELVEFDEDELLDDDFDEFEED